MKWTSFKFAFLGAIICGLPSVFTTILKIDLPDWVTVVALIVGLSLLATGAFIGIKDRKNKK